ncbi:hypothetical protein [Staphylococcus petrasii]|uniref:hypothetical protein n=1 Tax=Staphylococcus petrasii TaxID=1276936 RepID=UPI001F58C214|nr:hypothetical protein [Staphylococcus petrasii]MCI2773411.1 hypothetical protein [Staphylococcus petrasii]
MEKYGWTLTEVKNEPYFPLLEILNTEQENQASKQENTSESDNKVYTGSDLKFLFGG